MSRNFKYEEKVDSRDYKLEARDLVKALKGLQMYEMYEIVIKQLQRSNSATKDKELTAVKETIEDILGGVRSSATYIGARRLKDMAKCATFVTTHNVINRVYEQYTK